MPLKYHYSFITDNHAGDKKYIETIVSNLGTYFNDSDLDSVKHTGNEFSFTAGIPRPEKLIELLGKHAGGLWSNDPRLATTGALETVKYIISNDIVSIQNNGLEQPFSLPIFETSIGLHKLLIYKFTEIFDVAMRQHETQQRAMEYVKHAMSELREVMESENYEYVVYAYSYKNGGKIYISPRHIVAVTPECETKLDAAIRIYTTGGHSFLVDARYFDNEWRQANIDNK